jgi:light-regulated signal transduction histidine kinase (bacteriophytochrome)
MQQESINIAAHELRMPIMLILGYAELLEYEFDSTQEAKNYANISSRNAKIRKVRITLTDSFKNRK